MCTEPGMPVQFSLFTYMVPIVGQALISSFTQAADRCEGEKMHFTGRGCAFFQPGSTASV